jgi:NAD(P)-dependent dehydrogenase (short-subunit alcohol dehydrogenase family)
MEPDKVDQFGQQTPLNRAGQPAEVASAFVFLASQEASYISGEIPCRYWREAPEMIAHVRDDGGGRAPWRAR